jgi:predicted O-methyltransferase YrrM
MGAELRGGAGLAQWRDFLTSRVDPIPGWLHHEAALLTLHLSRLQRGAGLEGGVLEIGVFKGKYLSVLYHASAAGEAVVGVDLFVGADDAASIAEAVRQNIVGACGSAARLKVIVADSLQLTHDRVRADSGCDSFRLISIDGGHTKEVVSHDLELACALLCPGGIIALDDAFNHTTPGVIEGITEFFFRRQPSLAPFAHCYNKLFVTTPDHHERYLLATLDFLAATPWLPASERTLHGRRESRSIGFTPTLFGYEIVPFL